MRAVKDLHKHPAYKEVALVVSPMQLAAVQRVGNAALKDPLLINRDGIVIDGYARKEYADRLGIPTLPCLEIDVDTEEALVLMLSKHRRSAGWNDYNRIRMALRLKDSFRKQARSNQQTGGHLKGSSKLTEVSVRKSIADAAGVGEGNITKVEQLAHSEPLVLKALASGEIRIHRAWLWRGLSIEQQREELRLYRLKRNLTQASKIRAFRHQATRSSTVSKVWIRVPELERLLEQLISLSPCDCESSDLITIGVIKFPSKAALLTTRLYEDLLARRRAHAPQQHI